MCFLKVRVRAAYIKVSRILKLSNERPDYSGKLEESAVQLSELNLRVKISHGKFVVEEELEICL
jgi:hypothetical protein